MPFEFISETEDYNGERNQENIEKDQEPKIKSSSYIHNSYFQSFFLFLLNFNFFLFSFKIYFIQIWLKNHSDNKVWLSFCIQVGSQLKTNKTGSQHRILFLLLFIKNKNLYIFSKYN